MTTDTPSTHHSRRRRRPSARLLLAAGALVTVTGLVVAGCSSGGSDSGGSSAGGDSGAQPAATSTSGTTGERQDAKGSTSGTDVEPAQDQQLTYTATLSLDVTNVGTRLGQAETVVTKAGGYVANQYQYGGANGSATTTFKVPAAKYRSVLASLQKLGSRTSLSQTTENVTEQIADVDARTKTAEASLTRLRALLKKAAGLRDVLALESAIETREADLEALQARQRALAKQVAYATVTLNLSGPDAPAPAPKRGFLVGLTAGWHGFGVFVAGFLTVLGAALPFLVLAGVLAFAGIAGFRYGRRVRRTRKGGGPDPDPEPAES